MGRRASGKIRISRIIRKQKNGDRYVFEEASQYDPNKGYNVPIKGQSKCLGKMKPGSDDKYDLLPLRPRTTKKNVAESPQAEEKPEEKSEKLTSSATQAEDSIVTFNRVGMTDILRFFSEKSGVNGEITEVLKNDKGLALKLETLAWYNFATDGKSWPGIQNWSLAHLKTLPYPYTPISADIYHDVFVYLGNNPNIKYSIFKGRIDRIKGKGPLLIALDSTTVSAFVTRNVLIRDSIHKSGKVEPVYKIVFLYAIGENTPISYVLLPGNVPDSQTIPMALAELRGLSLGIEDAEMVDDNGYCSDETICIMDKNNQSFITRIETSIRWIGDIITKNKEEILNGEFLECDPKFTGAKFEMLRKVNRRKRANDPPDTVYSSDVSLNVFIYHSYTNQTKAENSFREKYTRYKAMLLAGVELGDERKEIERFCKKYMHISRNSDGTIVEITRNRKACEENSRWFGYLVVLTNKENDLEKALVKFRLREKIEEDIRNFKSHCNGDSTRVWDETTLDGQILAEFESLTIREYMQSRINEVEKSLAVKNEDSEHDTSDNLKVERQLRTWLHKTSLVDVLNWYDAVTQTTLKNDKEVLEWVTPYSRRDETLLKKLGMFDNEDQLTS